MSRDGTKEIKLHERKTADEILKYSIFDLANRVVDYSKLPPQMRQSVMSYCAKVLFYDFGYKSVKGLSARNIADWTKRLENAYENGSVTRPFRGQKKGRVSVVDKVEELSAVSSENTLGTHRMQSVIRRRLMHWHAS